MLSLKERAIGPRVPRQPRGQTQKQLWGNWFEFVKKLDVSNMTNWGRDGQKFVQSCQETIQKALESQTEWVRAAGQTRKTS